MLVAKYTVNTGNNFAWISLDSLRRTITSEEKDGICVTLLFQFAFLWQVSRPFYLNFWNNQPTQNLYKNWMSQILLTLQKTWILPLNCHPHGIISLLMSGNFFCLIANYRDRAHLVTKLMLVFLYSRPQKNAGHMALKTVQCRNQTLCLIAFGNNKEPPIFGSPQLSYKSRPCPVSVSLCPLPSLCFQAMNNHHVQHVECMLGIGLRFHLSTLTYEIFDKWTRVTMDHNPLLEVRVQRSQVTSTYVLGNDMKSITNKLYMATLGSWKIMYINQHSIKCVH